jgi:hypothetical protein
VLRARVFVVERADHGRTDVDGMTAAEVTQGVIRQTRQRTGVVKMLIPALRSLLLPDTHQSGLHRSVIARVLGY